jgi:hypothetical protein
MWLLGFVARWSMLRGLPVLRRIPIVRDLPLVRGHFRIREIDFPRADRERLTRAVNKNTAAFIAPNHPEFGLDWMIDKEISTAVAPRMASWAAREIVGVAPAFWSRNNLVSNDGGDAAIDHSVRWALAGNGVLLHPEGSVHWTGGHVHPLFSGIAEMATEAARRAKAGRPVFIAPIVWRLRYVGDVSSALHSEMTTVERELGLERGDENDVAERFRALQEGVLARQMRLHGHDPRGLDFFDRQDAFREELVGELFARYAVERTSSTDRDLYRLKRAVNASRSRNVADGQRVGEAVRLAGFTRAYYGTPVLSQEQIFESLKRLRAALVCRGVRNAVHNYLPTPYGPRVLHIRVPEPVLVDPLRTQGEIGDRAAYVDELLAEVRSRMQAALDALGRERCPARSVGIEAPTSDLSRPNPFLRDPNPNPTPVVSRQGHCRPVLSTTDFADAPHSPSRFG